MGMLVTAPKQTMEDAGLEGSCSWRTQDGEKDLIISHLYAPFIVSFLFLLSDFQLLLIISFGIQARFFGILSNNPKCHLEQAHKVLDQFLSPTLPHLLPTQRITSSSSQEQQAISASAFFSKPSPPQATMSVSQCGLPKRSKPSPHIRKSPPSPYHPADYPSPSSQTSRAAVHTTKQSAMS